MEVVIIGGIAAGMSTAAKAMRVNRDAKITVVEMEDYISFGACGLPYYLGGQFDDENEMFARTVEQMQDAGLNVLAGHQVIHNDNDKKEVTIKNLKDGSEFTKAYDRLMIATGATATLPPIDHTDADNVYTITRLDKVKDLKDNLDQFQRIGVIGGGFIGVEVAEQLALLNKDVTLIHSREDLMNKTFDPEFSAMIKTSLEEVNVNVVTQERILKMDLEANKVYQLHSKDNTYSVDAVIIAIGFTPNTKFLEGQFDMLDNGAIIIDEFGQTSVEGVFAAGDCASIHHKFLGDYYNPLATYANKMGRTIGTNIVSDKKDWESYTNVLGTSAIKSGHSEAVVTGLREIDAQNLGLNYKTTMITTPNHTSYYPNREMISIKLVYDADTYALYGAQMMGKSDTVLRASGYTTAIHAGLTTKDIGFIDYAYSPPFASTWEALNVAANTAK